MTPRNESEGTMPSRIGVIIPAYNEGAGLRAFHHRLAAAMASLEPWEALYVNDGSTDDTLAVMTALRAEDPHVATLNLSRNFGKEIAISAGLDHVEGDAVVVIDADLQDPPEIIPALVARWREGFDTVYAQRRVRHGETWLKRATARGFYRLMSRLGRVQLPENVGDFRLMDRIVVDALKQLPERQRFMKGLFAWVGFRTVTLDYTRAPRTAGESKFSGFALWNFALEGFTSFSTAPLKIWTYLGALCALGTLFYGLYMLIVTVLFGNKVPGYASLFIAITFFGSVQLISIGLLGEYIGRIYVETKQRPAYLIRKSYGGGQPLAPPEN